MHIQVKLKCSRKAKIKACQLRHAYTSKLLIYSRKANIKACQFRHEYTSKIKML